MARTWRRWGARRRPAGTSGSRGPPRRPSCGRGSAPRPRRGGSRCGPTAWATRWPGGVPRRLGARRADRLAPGLGARRRGVRRAARRGRRVRRGRPAAGARVRAGAAGRVSVFAEEEGSRFGLACLGSRLAGGALDWAAARELRDRAGVALPDALEAAGCRARPGRRGSGRRTSGCWTVSAGSSSCTSSRAATSSTGARRSASAAGSGRTGATASTSPGGPTTRAPPGCRTGPTRC